MPTHRDDMTVAQAEQAEMNEIRGIQQSGIRNLVKGIGESVPDLIANIKKGSEAGGLEFVKLHAQLTMKVLGAASTPAPTQAVQVNVGNGGKKGSKPKGIVAPADDDDESTYSEDKRQMTMFLAHHGPMQEFEIGVQRHMSPKDVRSILCDRYWFNLTAQGYYPTEYAFNQEPRANPQAKTAANKPAKKQTAS